MRVYIGCFGSGLGHASRMLEVARELAIKGADVEFSSSGEVAALIASQGYNCNALPLADVRYSDSGAFDLGKTMLSSPSILGRTYQQLRMEISNIERFGPDAVLSDSALSTVIAAKLLQLPTFTVLNQLNLASTHGEEGALSRLLSTGTSAGMGKLWELSDEVLLPDLPPPYTISEKNLWGSNVGKTRYVGFLASAGNGPLDSAANDIDSSSKPKVFWQVSGPPLTRAVLLRRAFEAAEALAGRFSFVVSAGNPSSTTEATRIPGGWFYGWCNIAEHYFRVCDVVVSRAGHGTIGQAVASSRPSLLIPIPKQPEQEGNAEKAVRLGVSLSISQHEFTLAKVAPLLEELIAGPFKEKATHLGEFARRFDAKKQIVSTIEAAASGARPRPR